MNNWERRWTIEEGNLGTIEITLLKQLSIRMSLDKKYVTNQGKKRELAKKRFAAKQVDKRIKNMNRLFSEGRNIATNTRKSISAV